MKSTTLLILFFFVSLNFCHAQHTITGKINDEQNQSLPFANIILHKKGESSIIKGVVSDDKGNYIFEKVITGSYYIEVSMLGFETKKSEEFKLTEDKNIHFQLKEESQTLDEVIVKSKRPVIKQTAEKLVVDLEKSEMINSSLQDIMKKVPGVLVTNNGISIAGNTGVRILINGKTTEYMDVDTLLRDFPADNIAKIEIIEQPGAEYDASGTGAIINIILKKNVSIGTHGSATFWAGEDEGFEYGATASIASYKNKLNWQTNIGYSEPTWRDDLILVRTVNDEVYNQTTISPFAPKNFNISGNIDYYIDKNHSIGIGGQFRKRISERISSSDTYIENDIETNVLFSENAIDIDRITFNINPYYEYKTDKDKLVVDFNFVDYKNDNNNNLYDLAGSTVGFIDRRYLQNGKYTIKTYKIDYAKTFSDNFKLSLGVKNAFVNTENDLDSFLENNASFDLIEEESSQFLIEEIILASYAKIDAKSGKWNFSGGLRYEDSNTEGTSIFMLNNELTEEIQTRPIAKLFPSASVGKEITENISATLAYSYRIKRPSYSSLNSFATFFDPFSSEVGNPNLKPSFTNKFQFNLTYDGQPFFGIAHSRTKDEIFDLIQQDDTTAEITQQEVNVEDNANWNFRLFGPLSFIKDVEGYTGFIVVNNQFDSSIYNLALNKWNLYWFIQASYELPWKVNFELSANYGTGALQGQIEVDWLAGLDFSFGKKFLDDKLKANLGFNNMLNRGFIGFIDYGNGTANVDSNGSRQNIQLKLTYSFGDKFGKKKDKRNSSKDEENRINDDN